MKESDSTKHTLPPPAHTLPPTHTHDEGGGGWGGGEVRGLVATAQVLRERRIPEGGDSLVSSLNFSRNTPRNTSSGLKESSLVSSPDKFRRFSEARILKEKQIHIYNRV
jgi:hypothetical protein